VPPKKPLAWLGSTAVHSAGRVLSLPLKLALLRLLSSLLRNKGALGERWIIGHAKRSALS
jgi:hypothetical protein